MSTWDRIRERPVAFCLTVAGVEYRFYDKVDPYTDLMSNQVLNTDLEYTGVEAVTSVGDITALIDDVGGFARQDPVTVALLARDAYMPRQYAATAYPGQLPPPQRMQPFHIFRRVTPSGSTKKTRLAVSLPHGLAVTDVIVEDDVSGWGPFPRMIHIGQEALWADGADGDGTVLNPYRFTDCVRAVALTQTQGHVVSEIRGEHPYVTAEPVFWRGRRARIHVAELYPDGSVGEWKEYWRGFIDTSAELSSDGLGLRIAINPMTVAFDWDLGTADTSSTTQVVPNWHYLTKGKATDLVVKTYWPPGSLCNANLIQAATPGGGADDYVLIGNFNHVDDRFDPTLGDANVRHGTFQLEDAPDVDPEPCNAILNWGFGGWGQITFDPASPLVAAAMNLVTDALGNQVWTAKLLSAPATEFYPLTLMEGDDGDSELVPWPGRLIETINASRPYNSTDGPIASWADPLDGAATSDRWVYLDVRGESCQRLRARKSIRTSGEPSVVLEYSGQGLCWGGFITRPTGEIEQHRAWTGVIEAGDLVPFNSFVCAANPNEDHSIFDIVGAPDWWYQPGEPYIGPFENDIYTASAPSAEQTIRVSGEGTEVEVVITDSFEVFDPSDPGTLIGYVYEVAEAYRDTTKVIAQMPGDAVFTATAISQARGVSPPEFILQLMLSGQGRGINGAYDKMGMGMNFGEAEVDVESFEALSVPESLIGQTFEAMRGKSVGDQIKGLLVACNAQVAQVWDPGYNSWRIRLIDLTPVSNQNSSMTITDDSTSTPVTTGSDGRVVRSYEIEVNIPGPGVDGTSLKIPYIDGAARNAANGDQGEALKISLPGVKIGTSAGDQTVALLDIITGLRARLGYERNRWSVRMPLDAFDSAGNEWTISIGDTVTLTSVYAVDVNPTTPVTNRPCRVYGVRRSPRDGVLELKLIGYPGVMAGYVPAMRVASVVSPMVVEVYEDTYKPSTAGSRTSDAAYFAVGDAVWGVPTGDWGNRVANTIASIDTGTNQVEFNDPHGLAAEDTIRHASFLSATQEVKGYAYLADENGALGGGGYPGYIIV